MVLTLLFSTTVVITPPVIYNLTSSCLKTREYRNGIWYSSLFYVDSSQFRVCSRFDCLNLGNNSIDLYDSFKEDSVLFDVRIPSHMIETNKNLERLIDSGILMKGQNWNDLKRMLYRVVLQPESSILADIQEEKSRLTRQFTFGLQIRTGGNLANDFESTSMINETRLHQIPAQVLKICQSERINPAEWNLYISSDSDIATNYIRSVLGLFFNVVSSSKYKHGHTSSGRLSITTLKGALIDIHMLGDADILLVTQGSGFGRISAAMAYPHPVYLIPVHRTIVKRHPRLV